MQYCQLERKNTGKIYASCLLHRICSLKCGCRQCWMGTCAAIYGGMSRVGGNVTHQPVVYPIGQPVLPLDLF